MTTETAGPVERWAIEHGVSLPHPDNQNSTVQVMLDCVMLNSLIDFARQHDKRTVVLVQALEGLLTRIDAAHLENWKDRDVDWFALLRAQAALAAFKEEA